MLGRLLDPAAAATSLCCPYQVLWDTNLIPSSGQVADTGLLALPKLNLQVRPSHPLTSCRRTS